MGGTRSADAAATGCSYAASLDTFTDVVSGQTLASSTFNKIQCAIEKLQSDFKLPNYTVATRPSSPAQGQKIYITDATSSVTCNTGGGSTKVECLYNGSAWIVSGGGGGGGGGDVLTTAGNTWTTGDQDMGAATSFKIPVGAGAAPTVAGRIALDSTAGAVKVGVAGVTHTLESTTNKNTTYAGLTGGLLDAAQVPVSHAHSTGTADPLSATVVRAGQFFIRTDAGNEKCFFGAAANGNFFRCDNNSDTYGQFSNGTLATTALRNSTLQITPTLHTSLTRITEGGAGGADVWEMGTSAALRTRGFTIRIGSDNAAAPVLVDGDDEPNVWRNDIAAMTITQVVCFSDAGTPIIQLQRDDGSAANILSSNLTCTTSGATGAIAGAEDNLAVGDRINFSMVTAGGTARRVSVHVKTTLD